MHLIIAVLMIFGSLPLSLTKSTDNTSRDFSETPSPEWVKYQQERNDPKYNRRSAIVAQEPGQKTNTELKQSTRIIPKSGNTSTQPQNVEKTTSRQRSDNQNDDTHEPTTNTEEYEDEENNSKSEDFIDPNGLKFPSISGFVNFVKSLKKTWLKKSLFRIDNKIEFLYNLKETLLKAIGG